MTLQTASRKFKPLRKGSGESPAPLPTFRPSVTPRSAVKSRAVPGRKKPGVAGQVVRLVAELEKTLHKQIEFEGKMLDLLKLKKQAMREAKPEDIALCCELENAAVRQITELEKTRLKQIGDLTELLVPDATEPLTLMALAERMPEPTRGRLLVLRAMLREKAEHVREQLAITRRASEGLLHNVQGVIRNVTDSLAGAGTYRRPAAARQYQMAVSTFSTTA